MDLKEQAKQDYLAGMKIKDIAQKIGKSASTIRSWKSRYKWDGASDKVAKTATKNVATQHKNVAVSQKADQVIDELSDSDLTDKQKAFVIEYVRLFNATQAYINIYDVDYATAMVNGSRMLRNAKVQSLIQELREARLHDLGANRQDILTDLMKQSFSDIGNYLDFGKNDIQLKDEYGKDELDKDGKPLISHRSWVQLKDKSKVDTSLIKKVSIGRDGVVLDLYDKQAAQARLLAELNKQQPDALSDAQVRRAKAEAILAEAKAARVDDDQLSEEVMLAKIMDALEVGNLNDEEVES
ncbi:terminase small subunit [Weissella paramesenteroides]|uniref:Terminase n=1 Tax=Weissella paramesenteroides TaxID=1249 RepID=A0ABD4XHY2_WEIPA|nr:terminase small subunit [Weissella paramesenteroides]KAA8446540.1 terminase [Weissella paramesenteroides]KAA8454564.1 terminase [Weissella paramesenteroides]MDF8368861.1 terminase [Weissella paramesenteroides]MDF8370748.1 terminase [Weissella paramesenteroides]